MPLPHGVTVLNPYQDTVAFDLCQQFYSNYYNDHKPRTMIMGINPGRFGGGITGIPFTDPVHLEKSCSIKNTLQKKTELSSMFMYEMIAAYGGPEKFFSTFYISSVSPLGFTKEGKNLNYYDEPALMKKIMGFIESSLRAQLDFGINRNTAYCLGEGDNYKFFAMLNQQHKFFNEIVPLPHPRFIMQYKRKNKLEYIERYINAFNRISGGC